MYTGYRIHNQLIYGPIAYTGFMVDDGRINNPAGNDTSFRIEDDVIFGPDGQTEYYIDGDKIYGPDGSVPWTS